MGLSFGVGSALAAKKTNSSRKVYVLVSDAELNEARSGSQFSSPDTINFPILLFLSIKTGSRLGYTKDVLDTSSVEKKFSAFNWDAQVVDGHDCKAMADAVAKLNYESGPPHVLVAPHDIRQGRLLYGERNTVALFADERRAI